MDDICCDVCDSQFDENLVIPKVLDCGHSFCEACISKLIQTNPCCPKCRRNVSKDAVTYPTNYALLGISNGQASYLSLKCHLHCRLHVMNKFIDRKEELTKKKNEITSNLDLLKNGLSRLKEMIASDIDETNLNETNENLSELERDYKKVENVVLFNFCKMRMSVTINRTSFETSDKYLQEIYERLTNGEHIISVKKGEDKVKYGTVSVQDNMVVVHALCFSEMPKNAASLWFDDLKNCITASNFRTFLKLSYNEKGARLMIVMEMMNTQVALQFVRLCTGECGPVYKGCSYVRGDDIGYLQSIISVMKYLENGEEKSGCFDYGVDFCKYRKINATEQVVIGKSDGSFQILWCNVAFGRSKSMIGKVTSPADLDCLISYRVKSKLKIVDSGLLFQI